MPFLACQPWGCPDAGVSGARPDYTAGMRQTPADSGPRGASPRTQATYDRLRAAITTGRIRPRERLIEVDLAHDLDVSRTPVREALQRLAADGLVVPARRGWQVREFSLEEVRDIYEVLVPLEGYASRLVATRASDRELDRIARLNESLEASAWDPARLVEMNNRFHEAVVRMAKNRHLAEQLYRNRKFNFNHLIAPLYTEEETREALDDHRRIVRALLARDRDEAERVTREHVLHGLDRALDKLQLVSVARTAL